MFKLMRKMRVLRFVASAVLGLALMIGVFTLATPTMAQTYIIFDAQAQPSITRPLGINNAGLIVGITAGAAFPNTREIVGFINTSQANKQRGFMRDADGVITEFDAPSPCTSTAATRINNADTVAGICIDQVSNQSYGFVRDAQGNFTLFNPPGAFNINVVSLNAPGQIAV